MTTLSVYDKSGMRIGMVHVLDEVMIREHIRKGNTIERSPLMDKLHALQEKARRGKYTICAS